MPSRSRTLIFAILLIVITLATIAYGTYRTFSHQGEKALTQMTSAELALLEKVKLIRKGMSYNEVVILLGEPDRNALGLRPTWRVDGSAANQIAVYFVNDGVFKVRWLSLGDFIYEPALL